MEKAREARRRRILERGSDRLAFVTGQAESLPASSPPPPPPPEKEAEHPQDFFAPSSNNDVTGSRLPDQYSSSSNTGTSRGRSEAEMSKGIPKFHENDDVQVDNKEDDINTYEPGNRVEVKELQQERDTELPSTSMARTSTEEVTATIVSTSRVKKQQVTFSSRQISSAVSTSENMRLLCAIAISLLVVVSNRGFALGGSVVRSAVSFRPLLLVMMTDLTIVLWVLMTRRETDDKGKVRARTGAHESSGRTGDTLEALLVFHKAARSVFMDCSICAVVIISGLCV